MKIILFSHDVSTMFPYQINRSNDVWAHVKDTTIDGFRPYFDFWNMFLYDLQRKPPRAYKVCDDYFEDIDLNDGDVLQFKSIILLCYLVRDE